MTGLLFLIPAALFLGLLGLGAFFWSVKSGQFDDLDGSAMRIFIDDAEDDVGAVPPAEVMAVPDADAPPATKP